MTTKKLTGKLAAGVRKIKEAPSTVPAKPRHERAAAGRQAPAAGTASGAELHPARVWPD